MSNLDGLNKSPCGGTVQLNEGTYLLEVDGTETSQNDITGFSYHIINNVKQSTNPESPTNSEGRISFHNMENMQRQKMSLPRIKQFLASVYRIDGSASVPFPEQPDYTWGMLGSFVWSSDPNTGLWVNPLRGYLVVAHGVASITKASGNKFVKWSFEPAPQQTT